MTIAAPPGFSLPSVLKKDKPALQSSALWRFCIITTVLGLAISLHQINYLFFHSILGIFSTVVSCGIFMLAWHTQAILKNSLLLFIGIAYLFISGLDLVHTLAYPGMGVFPNLSADEPMQVWVAARFIESMALLVATTCIDKRPQPMLWTASFAMVTTAAVCIIFVWPVMPQCYATTQGMTLFKICSNYALSLILLAAIVSLYKHRLSLGKEVWRLLSGAAGLTIVSEMTFTLHIDVHGIANITGHCLKLGSVILIYLAIVRSGLIHPYKHAIQRLKQKETAIQKSEAAFKTIINASTDLVVLIDHRLFFVAANKAAAHAFNLTPADIGNRHITEMAPEEISGEQLKWINKVLTDGQYVQYEELHNGATLLNSIYPIINDLGQVVQLAIYRKDITRQKEAHHAIVESEAKFRMLAERIEDIFWIATPGTRRFVYLSPAFKTICGRSCEQRYLDPKRLTALIHPDDRSAVQAVVQALPMDEWEVEFRIVRPDGGVRWVQNRGYSIKDGQGRVVQTCGVVRDITNRINLQQRLVAAHHELEQRVQKRTQVLSVAIQHLKHQVAKRAKMQRIIKEKHSMLHTLLQAIPDRVSFKDIKGRYLLANHSFDAFYGLKDKNVAGHTDATLKSAEEAQRSVDRDRRVIQSGQMLRFESQQPSGPDSDCSHWDVRKVPVKNDKGAIIGILSLSRNVTDYKRRESQLRQSKAVLRAFLDGISDPMVMIDNNLRLVYINKAATHAHLNHSGQGKTGTCAGLLCDGQRNCHACLIPTLISHKEQYSYECVRNGKPERIEMVDFYPLSLDQDGLDGAIVRIRDITQAKRVERHMIHNEKMASLGMLISGIAHEINNPNSFITFNVPILKTYLKKIFMAMDAQPHAVSHNDWFGMDYKAFRKEIFGLLSNLSHGSARIDNIVSNLKTMANPTLPRERSQWTDILGVINKAVILCRGEIRKYVSNFEVEQSPVAVEAYVDPEGLEQVLINLLINAAHAADKPDARIWLRTRPADGDNPDVRIEVHDNGCGMDPATRDSIFDPFFTTKEPGVGTGLGLSVSYNLIRQMGAHIHVQSSLGQGTIFTIHLPIKKKEAVNNQQRQTAQPDAALALPALEGNP